MTIYLAAQFNAAGKVLSATFGDKLIAIFGTDYYPAMIIGAAVILFYTMMGGFFAVAWTDLVQGLLMLFALVILPAVGIFHFGGFGNVVIHMDKTDPNLLSTVFGKVGWPACAFAIGYFSFMFGYPGQPHILARYMAIKSPKKLRQGTLISMVWVILVIYGAIAVGIIGRCMMTDVEDPEKIFALLAKLLLPGWFAGILIAAAMAAVMSTADSQLLVATSAIAEDFYHKLIRKQASERTLLIISRTATLIIGLIAILLAKPRSAVFDLVVYAWGGLAASFGPAIIMSLYWKRTTKWGVAAGMITGMATVIIWNNVDKLSGFIELLVPGFIFPFIVIWLVSLMTKPPEGIDDDFKAMKRPLPNQAL